MREFVIGLYKFANQRIIQRTMFEGLILFPAQRILVEDLDREVQELMDPNRRE